MTLCVYLTRVYNYICVSMKTVSKCNCNGRRHSLTLFKIVATNETVWQVIMAYTTKQTQAESKSTHLGIDTSLQMKLLLIKLRKGKSLSKHSVHGKKAAMVLLKLFISGTERCNTTACLPACLPSCLSVCLSHELNAIFKCKQHTIHDPWTNNIYTQ